MGHGVAEGISSQVLGSGFNPELRLEFCMHRGSLVSSQKHDSRWIGYCKQPLHVCALWVHFHLTARVLWKDSVSTVTCSRTKRRLRVDE